MEPERTKRPYAAASKNDPSLAQGLGKAPTRTEKLQTQNINKPKKQRNLNSQVLRTAASSAPVTHDPKKLRLAAPSNRVVEGVDLFHLYNILLASKHARPAIRRSQLHTTKQTPPTDQAPILTTTDAARVFKVSSKTFLQRYAPLLHPVPSANRSSRRRHLRWSRFEIERLARGQVASEFEPEAPNAERTFVSRALEKRLE